MDLIPDLAVERLVPGGFGLARDAEGKVILVRGAFPGERVSARRVRRYKRHDIAVLEDIADPSIHRGPACPHFPLCGGCALSGLKSDIQLTWKQAWLGEMLGHALGWNGSDLKTHPSPLHYRLRNRFAPSPEGWGFHTWKGRSVVPLETCRLITPSCLDLIRTLPTASGSLWTLDAPDGETVLHALDRSRSRPHLHIQVEPYSFRVHVGGFFQTNRFLLPAYHDFLRRALPDSGLKTALDLYAGVGFFTLPLSDCADRVVAVERSASACKDLRFNSGGRNHIHVEEDSVETFLSSWNGPVDLLLADPPREGLDPAVLEAILALKATTLILFSCDAATLVRDLKQLVTPGHYVLHTVELFDQFPETAHMEIGAVLHAGEVSPVLQ